jgi:hypothetical protein
MAEPIRISIGNEPKCWLCSEVLKSSIVRRTDRLITFSESWTLGKGWHRLVEERPRLKSGTKFSAWRWLVPEAYQCEGKAIYLDSDIVVLADIAELWDGLEPDVMFSCVTDVSGEDLWGFPTTIEQTGKVYKNKPQTSVMAMNLDRCVWKCENEFRRRKYATLMQARWIHPSQIQSLDPQWNRFGLCDAGTKLLHWSHVASQPQRRPDHPTADVFDAELTEAVREGHVRPEDIRREIKLGHVHKIWKRG